MIKITYEDIGKEFIFSDDQDFEESTRDILIDIVEIQDETWYQTEDNGLMPYIKDFEVEA